MEDKLNKMKVIAAERMAKSSKPAIVAKMPVEMTDIEKKCNAIFGILSKRPEFIDDISTGEFKNLDKLGVRYKYEDTEEILFCVHFDTTHTEFLPDERLFWKELPSGEYEKIVDRLYKAVTKGIE